MKIGLIPARGGSKGIKRKNIKHFCGKPLISWTIKQAIDSECLDRVIVSTDDKEIADIAIENGAEVPFLRPKSLSKDDSSSISCVMHLINKIPDIKFVLFLQPTSPLREASDIKGIFELQQKSNAESLVSLTLTPKHPSLMYKLKDNKKIEPIYSEAAFRRQDFSNIYLLNGALYLCSRDFLMKENNFINEQTIGYLMPNERSVDVDDSDDWIFAERKFKELYGSL